MRKEERRERDLEGKKKSSKGIEGITGASEDKGNIYRKVGEGGSKERQRKRNRKKDESNDL